MAKCPKCNARLHIYNVSQFCPKCGTNMRYVNFEENFLREAKIAELTQATVHVKVRRLKAAFVGGKLQILRLVFMLLPVAAEVSPAAVLPGEGDLPVRLRHRRARGHGCCLRR